MTKATEEHLEYSTSVITLPADSVVRIEVNGNCNRDSRDMDLNLLLAALAAAQRGDWNTVFILRDAALALASLGDASATADYVHIADLIEDAWPRP